MIVKADVEELFKSHYREIYNWFYYRTRDSHLSEDLTSQTFLEAARSLSSWKKKSTLKTWLFGIARNVWRHYIRQLQQDKMVDQTSIMDLAEVLMAAKNPGPQKQIRLTLAKETVESCLHNMPFRTRQVVTMRFNGYSFAVIAAAVGISENSARTIDYRARRQLKEALKKEGFYVYGDL